MTGMAELRHSRKTEFGRISSVSKLAKIDPKETVGVAHNRYSTWQANGSAHGGFPGLAPCYQQAVH